MTSEAWLDTFDTLSCDTALRIRQAIELVKFVNRYAGSVAHFRRVAAAKRTGDDCPGYPYRCAASAQIPDPS